MGTILKRASRRRLLGEVHLLEEGLEAGVGADGLSFPQARNFLRPTFACFTQVLTLWKPGLSGNLESNNGKGSCLAERVLT